MQPAFQKVSSPIGILFRGFGTFIAGFLKMFTKPKALLAMLLSVSVWLVLILLPRLGIENPLIKVFSFLTYAEGGKTAFKGFIDGKDPDKIMDDTINSMGKGFSDAFVDNTVGNANPIIGEVMKMTPNED